MLILAYLVRQSTKHHRAGWASWLLTFILMWWHWIQQRKSECASNFVNILENMPWRLLQRSQKHLGKMAWAVQGYLNGKDQTHRDQKRGLFTKVTLAGQTVNSAYHWTFYGDWGKCVKTLAQTFATNEMAVASQQCTISHQGILTKKCHPPTTLLTWLGPSQHFSASPIEDTAILTQLRCSRQNRRGAEHNLQDAFK
jgi:hypothetical protein